MQQAYHAKLKIRAKSFIKLGLDRCLIGQFRPYLIKISVLNTSVNVRYLHLSLIFAAKSGAYPLLYAQALLAKIRLGWKYLRVSNTLAYYNTVA